MSSLAHSPTSPVASGSPSAIASPTGRKKAPDGEPELKAWGEIAQRLRLASGLAIRPNTIAAGNDSAVASHESEGRAARECSGSSQMNARAFLSHWEASAYSGVHRRWSGEISASRKRRGRRRPSGGTPWVTACQVSFRPAMKSPRNARMRCPISPPPSRKRREPFNCDVSVLHRCRHGNGPSAPQNVTQVRLRGTGGGAKK